MTEPRDEVAGTAGGGRRAAAGSGDRAGRPICDGGVESAVGGRRVLPPAASVDDREVTVLHVDDDPGMGDLVASFLERTGEDVTVLTETDAAAGLDRVAGGAVDRVVTDLEMPGMDGLALVRALAAEHPDVPVVLFTSRAWEDVAGEDGAGHVAGHVRKGGPGQLEALAERALAAPE